MNIQHILLAIFWIIFGVLHSWLASIGVKNKIGKFFGADFKYYRICYTLFAFVSMTAIIGYQLSIMSPLLFQPTNGSNIIGCVGAVTGVIIMFICIKKYFFSLSGLRALIIEHKGADLIITGIHRYVRHPLYLGTFLFIWSLFILFPHLSLLIADIIITTYTLIGIYFEEAKLEAQFGESYKRYKATVPKLIPFLKG
ncbi:MAG: hypothetical protein C4329_08355 [Chitinophagaceae bacterium]